MLWLFYRRLMVFIFFCCPLNLVMHVGQDRYRNPKSEMCLYGDLMVHGTWGNERRSMRSGGVDQTFALIWWHLTRRFSSLLESSKVEDCRWMSGPNVLTQYWVVFNSWRLYMKSFKMKSSQQTSQFNVGFRIELQQNFSCSAFLFSCWLQILSESIFRFETFLNSIVIPNLLLVLKWLKA